MQKYLFTFQTNEDKLTGKAAVEAGGQKREAEFTEGKITGDTVSFVEMLNWQGNEIRIQYTGKLGTNEIEFKREVGDFATENFKATRVAATATNASARSARPMQPLAGRKNRESIAVGTSCSGRMTNRRSPIRPPASTSNGTTFPMASAR